MFPDDFDAFWALQSQFGSLIALHEACRCLVVCKQVVWGHSRFWEIWGGKSPGEKRVHSGPKDASSAYLFFIRVRVTQLVYQIGLTTFFRLQGRENILATSSSSSSSSKQQQAAAASKQATELISAYPHISVIRRNIA